jgi:putative peptidoglycan lipid II flippase
MMRRIFSTQSRTITGAAIILGIASFCSRVIGVVRDRVFAHVFGADAVLDAYYAAFRIPDFIYNLLIVGALSAGFIPIFLELYQKNKTEAWKFTSAIIRISSILLIIISSILFFSMPWLIQKTLPGMDQTTLEKTILLSRIMLISPILLGLSSIISSVLQALKHFLIFSLTPILYNIGIIIGATVFVPLFGIAGLAYGVVLGALCHLLIQLPILFRIGFRAETPLRLTDTAVKKIGTMMIPRTIGLAANQITFIILTSLASTIGVGSIAVYNPDFIGASSTRKKIRIY